MMYSSPYISNNTGKRSPQVRTSATNTSLYTPVGQLVGAATSPELKGVDRARNQAVVQAISNYATGPQEALEAINYRLSLRMAHVNILTLVLLQSCMIACGERFHLRAIHSETIRCISVVCTLKTKVGNLACEMLQIWYSSFLEVADQYRPLYEVYASLRMDEIEFPKIDPNRVIILEKKEPPKKALDKRRPSGTASKSLNPANPQGNQVQSTSNTQHPNSKPNTQATHSVPRTTQPSQQQPAERTGSTQAEGAQSSGSGQPQANNTSQKPNNPTSTTTQSRPRPPPKSVLLAPGQFRPPNTKVLLRDDQLVKARADLASVASHVDLLLALLTQVPADISPTKSALLVNVYNNAKQMRAKIHYLIQRIDHKELKGELQRASDKLTVAFQMYDHAVAFAQGLLEDGEDASRVDDNDEWFVGSDSESTRIRKTSLGLRPKHKSMTNLMSQKENGTRKTRGVENSFKYKRSESLPSFDVINSTSSRASRTSSEIMRQRRASLKGSRHERKKSADDLTEVKF